MSADQENNLEKDVPVAQEQPVINFATEEEEGLRDLSSTVSSSDQESNILPMNENYLEKDVPVAQQQPAFILSAEEEESLRNLSSAASTSDQESIIWPMNENDLEKDVPVAQQQTVFILSEEEGLSDLSSAILSSNQESIILPMNVNDLEKDVPVAQQQAVFILSAEEEKGLKDLSSAVPYSLITNQQNQAVHTKFDDDTKSVDMFLDHEPTINGNANNQLTVNEDKRYTAKFVFLF